MFPLQKLLSSNDQEIIDYVTADSELNITKYVKRTIEQNDNKMFDKLIKLITIDNKLDSETIVEIVSYTIRYDRYDMLEMLIRDLDMKSLDPPYIMKIIKQSVYYNRHKILGTLLKYFDVKNLTTTNHKESPCHLLYSALGQGNSGAYHECLIFLIKEGFDFCDCVPTKYRLIIEYIKNLFEGKEMKSLDREFPVLLATDEEFNTYKIVHCKEKTITDMLCNIIIENDSKMFHKFILEHPTCVNSTDTTNDSTPIMHAAQWGRYDMMETLLKTGASVADYIDRCGTNKSALYFAVHSPKEFSNNHIECIKILLRAGANIDILKEYSLDSHYLIKIIKDHMPEEKIIKLRNKSGVEYTIKLESIVPKPKSKSILIEVLSGSNESKSTYTVEPLRGTYLHVKFYDGSAKEGMITSSDVEVEIPTNKGSYHLLPVGICVDGIVLTEPVVCRFITGIGKTDSSFNRLVDLY